MRTQIQGSALQFIQQVSPPRSPLPPSRRLNHLQPPHSQGSIAALLGCVVLMGDPGLLYLLAAVLVEALRGHERRSVGVHHCDMYGEFDFWGRRGVFFTPKAFRWPTKLVPPRSVSSLFTLGPHLIPYVAPPSLTPRSPPPLTPLLPLPPLPPPPTSP